MSDVELRYLTRPGCWVDAVGVTGVDYNPQLGSFDGCPLTDVPAWVLEALQSQTLVIGNPGSTDYASFGIINPQGQRVWASPGDYLVNVEKVRAGKTVKQIVIVDGTFFNAFIETQRTHLPSHRLSSAAGELGN